MRDLVLFMMFAALVGTVYYNKQISKKLDDRDRVLSQEEKRLSRLEQDATQDRAQVEAELKGAESVLQQLREHLQRLQGTHDDLSARLVQAKNLNTGGRQVNSAQWDIGLQKKTVAQLEAQIKDFDSQRRDYKSQVDSYDQQQKLDRDRNLASLNEQIGLQNIKIGQMTDQYNNLKQQKIDLTAQYNARQLKPQIDDQKVILEQLKSQRSAVSLNWQARKNESANKMTAFMNDLNGKENAYKDQLAKEKNTYGQIDQRLKDSKNSEDQQRNEISKLEQDLKATDGTVSDLRKQIQDKVIQINELRAKLGKSSAAESLSRFIYVQPMERTEIPIAPLGDDPYVEFQKWYDLAGASGSLDFDAMVLATASKSGVPHARTVLYKGIKDGGIKFFTNYKSAKGRELSANPRAALVFYWSAIYRQVRVEGKVKKLSAQESEDYFRRRPRESQLGAVVSMQSEPVKSFGTLEKNFETLEKKFIGKEVPRPPHWGGFALHPEKFEFWVGRTRRLHRRICYSKKGKIWTKTFLSP